jgi:hypothetical protein
MEKKVELKSTSLHKAALFGNVHQVKDLAKQELSFYKQLTTKDENDNLSLDRAAPRGHYEIVKMLVEAHKKPGNEYVIHNAQKYSPFLSAVRWYLKVLDNKEELVAGNDKLGEFRKGKFNVGKSFSKDYLNIIKLLAKEYPEHTTKPDNKGCNAMVYAIYHFNSARIAVDNDKAQKRDPAKSLDKVCKIQEILELLISLKIPVLKEKIYNETWDKVARTISSMEKNGKEIENIKPQNTKVNTNNEKKTQSQALLPTNTPKPTFFSTQQLVKTTGNQNSVGPKKGMGGRATNGM